MSDFWDKRYAGEIYAYGERPNKFFREFIAGERPGKILFPADGEGRNGVFAAVLGWDVTSVDLSENARKKALKLAKKWHVDIKFIVQDLKEFDTDEKFDVIVSVFAHFPSEERKAIHAKLISMLKPGGKFMMEAFSKAQFENYSGGPRKLDMLYSIEDIKKDFEGMEMIMLGEYYIYLSEGSFHLGPAEVIRMIAKKKD